MAGVPSYLHISEVSGDTQSGAISILWIGAAHDKTSTTGDHRYIWATRDGTTWIQHDLGVGQYHVGGGAANNEGLHMVKKSGATHTFVRLQVNAAGTAITETTVSSHSTMSNLAFPGSSATFGNVFYHWGAGVLWQYANMYVNNAEATQAFAPFFSTPLDGSIHVDCIRIDNGVAFSMSWFGGTHVFAYREGAGEQIWFEPGLDNARMAFHKGSLFLFGSSGDRLKLIGLNLKQGVPIGLSQIRPESSGLSAVSVDPGPDASLLLGATAGGTNYDIFQYDIEQDSLSQIHRFSSSDAGAGQLKALTTFKGNRYALLNNASDDLISMKINKDIDTPSTIAYSLTDSAWDFNLPYEEKILHGIHVLHSPSTGTESFTIEYQLNESGTWVSLGVQTPSANTTHTYIPITTPASVIKFRDLRMRYTGPHQINKISVEAEAKASRELWELVIDLNDEAGNNRISGDQRRGEDIRDSILSLAETGEPVTFIDGYKYGRKEAQTTTDNVVVEVIDDNITRPGEGYMKVRLRRLHFHD